MPLMIHATECTPCEAIMLTLPETGVTKLPGYTVPVWVGAVAGARTQRKPTNLGVIVVILVNPSEKQVKYGRIQLQSLAPSHPKNDRRGVPKTPG